MQFINRAAIYINQGAIYKNQPLIYKIKPSKIKMYGVIFHTNTCFWDRKT